MEKLELYLEAERRGILPEDKAGLLAEARKRNLIPSLDTASTDLEASQDQFFQNYKQASEENEEFSLMQLSGMVGGAAGMLGKGILSGAAIGSVAGAATEEGLRLTKGQDFDPIRAATNTAIGTIGGGIVGGIVDTSGKLAKRILPHQVDIPSIKQSTVAALQDTRDGLRGQETEAWLRLNDLVNPINSPGASAFVRVNAKRNVIDKVTEPDVRKWALKLADNSIPKGKDAARISIRELSGFRTSLNRAFGTDKQKNRALEILKSSLDEDIERIVKSTLYNGSIEDAKKVRKAIEISKDIRQNWDSNKILNTLSSDDANPDEALSFLFHHNTVAKNKHAIKALDVIEATSPDTHKALVEAGKQKILYNPDGTLKTGKQINTYISRMNVEHNHLAKTLFGREWEKIRNMAPKFAKAQDISAITNLKEQINSPFAKIAGVAGSIATYEGVRSLWSNFK